MWFTFNMIWLKHFTEWIKVCFFLLVPLLTRNCVHALTLCPAILTLVQPGASSRHCQRGTFTFRTDGSISFKDTYSRSWALLEKLPIVQPIKNFPAFYGTRRFITVFTRFLHWSLSWVRSIQSIPSHPIALRPILILSTHLRLGLPSGLCPSGFPTPTSNMHSSSPFLLISLWLSKGLLTLPLAYNVSARTT
jgi:hypothetical protein